jgi:hypothetical protein
MLTRLPLELSWKILEFVPPNHLANLFVAVGFPHFCDSDWLDILLDERLWKHWLHSCHWKGHFNGNKRVRVWRLGQWKKSRNNLFPWRLWRCLEAFDRKASYSLVNTNSTPTQLMDWHPEHTSNWVVDGTFAIRNALIIHKFTLSSHPNTLLRSSILGETVAASSVDGGFQVGERGGRLQLAQGLHHVLQSTGNSFWSSRGDSNHDGFQWIIFKLQPNSQVSNFEISAFQAYYQHGEPIYSPQNVEIYMGDTDPTPLIVESLSKPDFHSQQVQELNNYVDFDALVELFPIRVEVDGVHAFPFVPISYPPMDPQHVSVDVTWSNSMESVVYTGDYVLMKLNGYIKRQASDNLWYQAIESVKIDGWHLNAFHRITEIMSENQ